LKTKKLLRLLLQPEAAEQVFETQVRAEGLQHGIRSQRSRGFPCSNRVSMRNRLRQPVKGAVLVAQYCIGVITLVGRVRKRRAWLPAGFLSVALLLLSSCGSSSQNQMTQTQQTYTATVTGTSGAIQHSTQLTLTVQ